MKITAVETLRLGEFPNILFVQVHTDEGVVGLGETFMGAAAVEAYIHETAAPYLLGEDATFIERHARHLRGYLGAGATGAETRGNSAIDIALWDIAGKNAGQPLHQILGGSCRDDVRVYNTCAGPRYIRSRPVQQVDNWGLPGAQGGELYEDLEGFLHHADELALSLLEQGVSAMKIWPFDRFAERHDGQGITAGELEEGLEPLRRIRSAVGNRMDVMIEFHSLWNLPAAGRIMRALDQYEPFWYEDPVKMDDGDALAALSRQVRVPIAASETLAGRRAFRRLLEQHVPFVVMLDVSWAGGVSEAKKIAAMAEAYQLPVTLHDCTGPVVLTASTHLSLHLPNALIQEMVRAFYYGWYKDLVTELPHVENGRIRPPGGAGLGTELQPGVRKRADCIRRETKWSDA